MQQNDTQSVTSPISKVGLVVDGHNIMLRRTLLKVSSTIEPPQRKNLFKTTCRSHGKICKVIVDSDFVENIVSTKMVGKLKCKIISHTTPNKVS